MERILKAPEIMQELKHIKTNPMKTQNLFLTFVAVIFLNSCYNTQTDKKVYYNRINELKNEGWSKSAATHIAKVEFKLIQEDSLYISYMED